MGGIGRHPDIAAMLPGWVDIDNVIAGPRAVKGYSAAGSVMQGDGRPTCRYLPRLPGHRVFTANGQTVDQYADYLRRAVLLPFAKPLLNRMVGMVFKREPTTKFPREIEGDKPNWTLNGLSFEAFAKQTLRQNASKGFGCISVDFSDVYDRPYHRLYAAGAVVDFDTREIGGREATTSVTFEEFYWRRTADGGRQRLCQQRTFELVPGLDVAGDVERPKNLDDIQAHLEQAPATDKEYPFGFLRQTVRRQAIDEKGDPKDEWVIAEVKFPTRRMRPLGFLTVVPFNPFGATWEVCEAPFLDLVDLILADFLVSADYHELGHKVGAGTVLSFMGFTAEQMAKIGAVGGGSAIYNENADASVEYKQTDGSGEAVLLNQRKDIREQIRIVVGRLLTPQDKNVAESAAAQEIQFSSEDANLQNITGATAIALEEAAKIAAWWAGTAPTLDDVTDVRVELNDDFLSTTISTDDMGQLGLLVDADRMTEDDFDYEVYEKGGRGRPGVSPEKRKAQLAAQRAARPEVGIAEAPPAEGRP